VQPVQATRRLTLRQFTAADADDLLALDADPEVMRFLDSKTKSLAQIQSEVLPRFLACYDRYPGFGFWAAHAPQRRRVHRVVRAAAGDSHRCGGGGLARRTTW
jgi:RimJ/RimL family protein N-acetyltransferase